MPKRLLLIIVLTLTATTFVNAPPATAAPDGLWKSMCLYSHRLPDDPIVKPGQPGGSHSHDFLGNNSTQAHSTYESMLAGGTTCEDTLDTAGYWVPTLYNNSRLITPTRILAYYRLGGKRPEHISTPPADLRIVAGNAKATAAQPTSVIRWYCTNTSTGVPYSPLVYNKPPTCMGNTQLALTIKFPSCWDGVNLDFPDHKSHMRYSDTLNCPASHPVTLPKLTMTLYYPTNGGSGVRLASGSAYTAHADFWNTWDQARLNYLTEYCVKGTRDCDTTPPPA